MVRYCEISCLDLACARVLLGFMAHVRSRGG